MYLASCNKHKRQTAPLLKVQVQETVHFRPLKEHNVESFTHVEYVWPGWINLGTPPNPPTVIRGSDLGCFGPDAWKQLPGAMDAGIVCSS